MGEILIKENELFKEWAKNRPGFVSDGLINEEEYLASKIKILYVLKEVNDIGGGNWDLRSFVNNGARESTWDNITRWTIGIRNIEREVTWDEIENISQDERKKYLRSIGAINLKKTPGDYICDENDLQKIANEDKKYLKKQISLYTPDLILCCGTSNIYHSIFTEPVNWKRTSRGVWYYHFENNRYLVSYVHPEARVSSNIIYYGLIDAIKEIIL